MELKKELEILKKNKEPELREMFFRKQRLEVLSNTRKQLSDEMERLKEKYGIVNAKVDGKDTYISISHGLKLRPAKYKKAVEIVTALNEAMNTIRAGEKTMSLDDVKECVDKLSKTSNRVSAGRFLSGQREPSKSSKRITEIMDYLNKQVDWRDLSVEQVVVEESKFNKSNKQG